MKLIKNETTKEKLHNIIYLNNKSKKNDNKIAI